MARSDENRRTGWYGGRAVAPDQSALYSPVPGGTQGASGFGLDVYECVGQYAGARQCRYPAGAEGHEGVARAEPQKRHGHRCDADVSGAECLGAHPDTHRGDDLSGPDGGGQSVGRFPAYSHRHLYGYLCRASGLVYQAAYQYIRPGNRAVGARAHRLCGWGLLLLFVVARR